MMQGQDDLDRDLREELESHVRMRAEHDGTGLAAARRKLGNPLRLQEEMRAMHISNWIDEALQDLRYAFRRAARNPGFTFAVISAIALGIGATSSVFSVVDRILFRPLPYANEQELVWLGMTAPLFGDEFLLGGDYFDWKEQQTVFTQITAMRGVEECDATEENPVRFQCLVAGPDYLSTFGLTPMLGRSFTQGEEDAVLISHALWLKRFSGAADALTRTLSLNGRTYRIVGILPANFEVPSLAPVDIMKPLGLNEARERTRKGPMTFLRVWGRLKPGVTFARAEQAMQPLMQASLQFVPPSFVKEVKLAMSPLRERQTRQARRISLALFAAVLSVLLIACANVANLLLARASASERETAIRQAIGASRSRLIRQNLTESSLFAGVGGVLGLALGWALLRIAAAVAPAAIPRLRDAQLDGRVLLLAAVLTIVCGLVTGAVAAFRTGWTAGLLSPNLSGARVTHASHRFVRPALVTVQIALASALLYCATLLGDSVHRMQQEPLGFQAVNILTTSVQLRDSAYTQPAAREAFWHALQERIARLPGGTAAAMSDSLPPKGRAMVRILSRMRIDGKPEDIRNGTGGMVVAREVTPEYFRVLGIRQLYGRGFQEADRTSDPPPLILSERLAQKLFGSSAGAVGHLLQAGVGSPWSPVVGVVSDIRNAGLDAGDPEFYSPLSSKTQRGGMALLVRTQGHPSLLQDLIRSEIHALDAHIPLVFETMEQRTGQLTAGARFNAAVLAFFSAAGLILGSTGVFSVVSFLVSRRTREIGVRVALGATAANIRGMVLRGALVWAIAGCVAGGVMIVALLPQLQHLTYQSRLGSPWAAAAVLGAMSLLAILSALGPALRAARVDPASTLRTD